MYSLPGIGSFAYSQNPTFIAIPVQLSASEQAELSQQLSSYETFSLNTQAIYNYVSANSETSQFSLDIGGTVTDFVIRPHEVLANNADVIYEGANSQTTISHHDINTYKGHVLGLPASKAYFYISDQVFKVIYESGNDKVNIDNPLLLLGSSVQANIYLKYTDGDKVACTGCNTNDHICITPESIEPVPDNQTCLGCDLNPCEFIDLSNEPTRTIEIAVDVDHSFYQLLGSNDAEVRAEVEMNLMLAAEPYIRYFKTKFECVFLHIWTSSQGANYPYSSNNLNTLLDAFQQHWKHNFGCVHRDIAHLFIGKKPDRGCGVTYGSTPSHESKKYCNQWLVEDRNRKDYSVSSFKLTSSSPYLRAPVLIAHETAHQLDINGHTLCEGDAIMRESGSCAGAKIDEYGFTRSIQGLIWGTLSSHDCFLDCKACDKQPLINNDCERCLIETSFTASNTGPNLALCDWKRTDFEFTVCNNCEARTIEEISAVLKISTFEDINRGDFSNSKSEGLEFK